MRTSFKKVSLEQFSELLARFPFSRTINAVHMHHTWRPNHRQFKGEETILAMWRFHTEHNGWSDIAQHITIDPNGEIWLGRDWNAPPASAKGFNGDSRKGPFMFEMIGDFDVGADRFEGKQRSTAIAVVALLQQQFGLPLASLKFHNMMSGKTCPGSAIDYQRVLDDVDRNRREIGQQRRALLESEPPFHPDAQVASADLAELIDAMRSATPDDIAAFEADADACVHHHDHEDARHEAHMAYAADGRRSTPAPQTDLRPHLVNLSMGELSSSGQWSTTRADVEAIFNAHLPRALERAKAAGRPLRLMFQAHGGLNDEAAGLAIARKSVAWWLANDIYPIYFVWETGLFESIGQLLQRATTGKRDLFDFTTDPLIQESVRLLGAPKIWGVMKQNAKVASSPDTVGDMRQPQPGREGGAYLVAQQLAAFCKRHGDAVELHAVGHSAGAIFHSWFIPSALAVGVPPFDSLHLMAPAVRVDLFKENLAPLLGDRTGIRDITLYTMKEPLEARDSVANIYHKSLLYLIFHALEPQRKTPILGLEESLRADDELSRMFGLSGAPGRAQVVWSRTQASSGASASLATTHGGFDDDPATMSSIARRILNRGDHESIVEYTASPEGERGAGWGLGDLQGMPGLTIEQLLKRPDQGGEIRLGDKRGMRRALCVGINAYAGQPLAGCLKDVESWSGVLRRAGFEVTRLLDREATRANIMTQLDRLIADSRPGDVIVFQYSGHGTQMPDRNGDDKDGRDEALVPYDYQQGTFLLDDELGEMYARVPDGVNLTCFMDCCHSGDNSRLFLAEGDQRQRFMPPTEEMISAFLAYREKVIGDAGAARAFAPTVEAKPTFEVSFAACSPSESAWESEGQGEFTVRATAILAREVDRLANGGKDDALTNGEFMERVRAAFGGTPRQHVQLDTSFRGSAKRALLQPFVGPHSGPQAGLQPRPQPDVQPDPQLDSQQQPGGAAAKQTDIPASPDLAQVLARLQQIEQLLQQAQLQPASVYDRRRANGGTQITPSQSLQHGVQQNR